MTQSSLQCVAVGHAGAIGKCIKEYSALVWSLARRLSRTPSDAEDATQEIFLAVWRHAGRFDPSKGSEKAFIMMIARRRLIDRMRRQTLEPPMESMDAIDELNADRFDAQFSSALENTQVVRALAALRPDQREVLELSLIDGFTQSEIALRLAMPLGSVKSAMRRGLLKLREFSHPPRSDWTAMRS